MYNLEKNLGRTILVLISILCIPTLNHSFRTSWENESIKLCHAHVLINYNRLKNNYVNRCIKIKDNELDY